MHCEFVEGGGEEPTHHFFWQIATAKIATEFPVFVINYRGAHGQRRRCP